VRGVALISSAFPANQFDVELYWELLKDLEAQDYEVSILSIVKTLKDIYPGTNLIAMIRDRANENKKSRLGKMTALPNLDCAPPPQEWLDAKEKLKNSNGI